MLMMEYLSDFIYILKQKTLSEPSKEICFGLAHVEDNLGLYKWGKLFCLWLVGLYSFEVLSNL